MRRTRSRAPDPDTLHSAADPGRENPNREFLMQAQHIAFLQLLSGDVQYVVPRWQRRYCWDQSDIERLVKDLMTIAKADHPGAAH